MRPWVLTGRVLWVVYVALGAAVSTALICADSARAAYPGRDGGFLLLVNARPGHGQQLWVTDPSGKRRHQILTVRCGWFKDAAFSPSGRTVAVEEYNEFGPLHHCSPHTGQNFPASSHTHVEIVLVGSDGSDRRTLTRVTENDYSSGGNARYPAVFLPGQLSWSPDGRTLTFGRPWVGLHTHGVQVEFLDVATGKPERTVIIPADVGPTWATTGQLLFYDEGTDTQFVATPAAGAPARWINIGFAGSAAQDLVDDSASGYGGPPISPDGSQVAFIAFSAFDPGGDLFISSTTDGAVRQLTRSHDIRCPVWAPDGHQIVYDQSGRYRVISLVTGRIKTVTFPRFAPEEVLERVLDWQPLPSTPSR